LGAADVASRETDDDVSKTKRSCAGEWRRSSFFTVGNNPPTFFTSLSYHNQAQIQAH